MKRVIIDCDPGIDDMAAILLALGSPELEVVAVTTTYGNASVETCTANALRVLAAAGRSDIPVFMGASKPLLRPANEGWASHIHGGDGLGGILGVGGDPPSGQLQDKHATLAITDAVMAAPGELTILALGRMTNVALALSLEPRVAGAVQEIVVMGGAVTVPGNVSGVATANLHEDPEAAAIVYRSGAPIAQVGLDVCNRVTVSPAQLEAIAAAGSPATQLLSEATAYLRESYIRIGRIGADEGVRYNDMPAVGYAINPALFDARPDFVEIETHSELTMGQTVADWNAT
ncbi:MAG: nucleoside hydrolase, partial [Chloroflexi bacterium]|nr:nucleoside hydrolase [Chloroflexota bacterium]